MKRKKIQQLIASGVATLALVLGLAGGMASAAATKVTICHATASSTNPYVSESVDVNSLKNGHGHSGVNSGDIIPPTAGTDFPNGQNWTAQGQATYNHGTCKAAATNPGGGTTGGTTTTTTPGSVLGASTQTQVGAAPSGAVNGGAGGAAFKYSVASTAGLLSSVAVVGAGLTWAAKSKLKVQ